VLHQVRKIQSVMAQVMKEGEHYGTIPGTQKPTLLKPGAEKLLLTFRFDPEYESTKTYDGAHLTIDSKCTLYHIPSGQRMGSGEGMCSTKESKYAYRKGARLCPECGQDAIIKGRAEYGGGWVCFAKKGGCGAKWKDGAAAIEGQSVDRVPNPDLADCYNTVKKIANKRALVAAVLNVTAASDIFTQDLEDTDLPDVKSGGPRGGDRSQAVPVAPMPSDPDELAQDESLFRVPEDVALKDQLVREIGDIIKRELARKKITADDVKTYKQTYLGSPDADPRKCDVAALTDMSKFLLSRFGA
jgi:nitrite reductase/ring-hydroxylating ferredoxin subunit